MPVHVNLYPLNASELICSVLAINGTMLSAPSPELLEAVTSMVTPNATVSLVVGIMVGAGIGRGVVGLIVGADVGADVGDGTGAA